MTKSEQNDLKRDRHIAHRILLLQHSGATDSLEMATASVSISLQKEAIEKAAADICNAIADYR